MRFLLGYAKSITYVIDLRQAIPGLQESLNFSEIPSEPAAFQFFGRMLSCRIDFDPIKW